MNVSLVQDWSRFRLLEAEWRHLVARSQADALFFTWEWMEAWLDVLAPRRRPFIIVVRDAADRLVAVAPFYLFAARLGGLVPFRVLRMAADYPTGAEYQDWVVDPVHEKEATLAIATALQQSTAWDLLWMPYCATWTGAAHRIRAACSAAGLSLNERPIEYAQFDLPNDMEAYIGALSAKQRKKVRGFRRTILSDPNVSVEVCSEPGQVESFLEALFELNANRWRARGLPGTFRKKPDEAEFYRRFVPRALGKGWLRLLGLKEGGVFKAIQIGYVYGSSFLAVQEGFDPSHNGGVGNALRTHVISRCIDERVRSYDFLAEFNENKARWGATPRPGLQFLIGRKTVKNAPILGLNVWPTGRYFRFDEIPREAVPAPVEAN